MRRKTWLSLPLLLVIGSYCTAQLWTGILDPTRAIDWSSAGVAGGIPARNVCTTVQASTYGNGSSDATSGIQSALNSCATGQAVALSAGTFRINGSLTIPSNVSLRGAGAKNTILDLHGSSNGALNLGSGDPNSGGAVSISSGASSGSTKITVSNASGISVGSYLLITEINNASFVTIAGGEGNCTWCDEFWNGTRARGQIVEVTSVSGTSIGITPGLYSAYTQTPQAVPFNASAKYAGVEDLQVYANNSGYTANFQLRQCAYCWLKGVEGNYTDGDHLQIHWGYRDEIRDSYFTNAYHHAPGTTDSDVFIVDKTSATLVENNILERLHYSIILNWGAAGNVIAYNYMDGNFDENSGNALMANLNTHGAHPQYNLWEGNVGAQLYADGVWGSSSDNTTYRSWMKGATYICSPLTGRAAINCGTGHWAFQAARAMQISFASTSYNFVGSVVGSSEMAGLKLNGNGNSMPAVAQLLWSANRAYDTTAYGFTFGYSELSDSGGLSEDSSNPFNTAFLHGNYNNVDGSLTWASGVTHTLPPSFYRSAKPSFWGTNPWPAMGPDVTGASGPGGHIGSIPAQVCHDGAAKDANGLLIFDADTCYGASTGPAAPTGLQAIVQ